MTDDVLIVRVFFATAVAAAMADFMLYIVIIFADFEGEKAGSEAQVVLPVTGHIVRGE